MDTRLLEPVSSDFDPHQSSLLPVLLLKAANATARPPAEFLDNSGADIFVSAPVAHSTKYSNPMEKQGENNGLMNKERLPVQG